MTNRRLATNRFSSYKYCHLSIFSVSEMKKEL
jgi:hypothetical protein